jgi:hypothetical protein
VPVASRRGDRRAAPQAWQKVKKPRAPFECAFWRDDRSAAPDRETYNAVLPGTVTLPGSMLIGISLPYKKSGLLYERWKEHYGRRRRAGDPCAIDGAQSDA